MSMRSFKFFLFSGAFFVIGGMVAFFAISASNHRGMTDPDTDNEKLYLGSAAENLNLLEINLKNETRNTYSDEEIYIYLIASSDAGPLKYYVITNRAQDDTGNPVYTLDAPTSVSFPYSVPYFNLSDLPNGRFYLQGGPTELLMLANLRLYISLGSKLPSFTLENESFYNAPTEITPWDIFEFGFDPTRTKSYGFNTTQVAGFSIPLYFTVSPGNKIDSNPPLPVGIKLPVTVSGKTLHSQSDIIHYYKKETAAGNNIFQFSHLGRRDTDNNERLESPSNPGMVNAASTYFGDSTAGPLANFKKKYKGNYSSSGKWPFRMCTDDPGPKSKIAYPGCAASQSKCPNTTKFPQCEASGNKCSGTPPTGNRNIGMCYVGYVQNNTFYYFTYQNDTPAMGKGTGTVGYNGSSEPVVTSPEEGMLLAIDLDSYPDNLTFTQCALQNNCYSAQANGTFNSQIMAAIMRNSVTNKESSGSFPYTRWTYSPAPSPTSSTSPYYQVEPYNWYAKVWHEISINHYAYGFGYDDAGGQSTTYTPDAGNLKSLTLHIQW